VFLRILRNTRLNLKNVTCDHHSVALSHVSGSYDLSHNVTEVWQHNAVSHNTSLITVLIDFIYKGIL